MLDPVEELTDLLLARAMKAATAESCTGGLLAAAITHKPGASRVFERGFVTYSNEAKTEMIGVPATLIAEKGAVSAEVAAAMAEGAIRHSRADIAVSITGIAGPDGGTPEKPVGLVFIGYAIKNGTSGTTKNIFTGGREEIQSQAAAAALMTLIEALKTL